MTLRFLALILLSFCTFTTSAQKKKAFTPKPAKKTVAKSASAVAEWLPTKTGAKFYLLSGPQKDTLLLKQFDAKVEPIETTITEFTSKGNKLIAVNWKETTSVKNPSKTENGLTVETRIFDPVAKTNVFENNQSTVNISEIVSLGGTQATKTVEKVRRDGCECRISPDGEVTLTSKTRNEKLTYDPKQGKYVSVPVKKK